MKRPERRYYPLDEFMFRDQSEYPEGRTLAIKRAAFPGRDGMQGDGMARLLVVDAEPDDYVLDSHTLASGLSAATAPLFVERAEFKKTQRRNGHVYKVEALRFAGQISMPDGRGIDAVGAYVPCELATGFLHLLESGRTPELFAAGMEAALDVPAGMPQPALREEGLLKDLVHA